MFDLFFHALVVALVVDRVRQLVTYWRPKCAGLAEKRILQSKLRGVALRMIANGENPGRWLMALLDAEPVNPPSTTRGDA